MAVAVSATATLAFTRTVTTRHPIAPTDAALVWRGVRPVRVFRRDDVRAAKRTPHECAGRSAGKRAGTFRPQRGEAPRLSRSASSARSPGRDLDDSAA